MLRVTLEIVPFGEEKEKRLIGTMQIGNITGFGDVCDYSVKLDGKQAWVENHARKDGAWALVQRAIGALEEEEGRL